MRKPGTDRSSHLKPAFMLLVILVLFGATGFVAAEVVVTPIGSSDDGASAIAIQSDGKIVVVGDTVNGAVIDFAVVRYNPDLTLDTSFDGDGIATTAIGAGNDAARAVAIQSDGRIVVAGYTLDGVSSTEDFAVARYNTDGSLDTGFDTDGIVTTTFRSPNNKDEQAHGVVIQADGKIVVVGHSPRNVNNWEFAVARYNNDGSLDAGFDTDGLATTALTTAHDRAFAVAQQPDGKIVTVGLAEVDPNPVDADYGLVRYNADGTTDNTFGAAGIVVTGFGGIGESAHDVVIQPDNKIVIVGGPACSVVRYNADGSLDTTFGGGTGRTTISVVNGNGCEEVALQPDGKIVAAGYALDAYAMPADIMVIRLNADGSPDTTFGGDGIVTTDLGGTAEEGHAVALQSDGKIVVAGTRNNGTDNDFVLVRYDADGSITPTYVELMSFAARGEKQSVLLEWETGSELDNLGFHIYRAPWEEGPYERITESIIPGLGSSPEGARYSYRDADLTPGGTYYYKLEDVDTRGNTELHGPLSATALVGETTEPEGDGPSEQGESRAGITYGEPSQNSLRVVMRDKNQLVLRLHTQGFRAEPQPGGTVRIEVPEFETPEGGRFAIPVKRAWVDVVAGRTVQLGSVRSLNEERLEGLHPSMEQMEVEATPRGTVRLQRSRRGRSRIPRGRGWYPEEAARVVSVGFQADMKKALVELAPIRWDGNRLVVARELEVHLLFPDRDVSERSLDGRGGRRYRRQRGRKGHGVAARLVTRERGLYGIGLEEVLGPAHGGIGASRLRLSRQGEEVPFRLMGTKLYFVSAGASANPFGREAIYELQVGLAGAQMPLVEARPQGEPVNHVWDRVVREENRLYQAALLEAPDVWLWDALFAPVKKAYPFEVRGLASLSEPSRIEIWLQGASDSGADPDHHIRIEVNGHFVEETSLNGKQPLRVEAELLPGVLHEGENILEIENVGDTEAAYSMLMLDRYQVSYPRVLSVVDGVLEGSFGESGVAEVDGVSFVLDVTEEAPLWLFGTDTGADKLRFRVEAGRTYLAVSPESVRQPEFRKVLARGLASTHKGADYLVIGPREFLDAAGPLLELRRTQGLRVEAVPIEAVYSEFGFGEPTPEAVRDFIAYAYQEWRAPSPRYVILLGDGTYDYKDYLGTGVQNRVPPYPIQTQYLWTASDPAYAAVHGDDTLPDLALGRIPAANVEELRLMVDKIVAFEMSRTSASGPIVLVTDNPDRAGDFDSNAAEIISTVLSGEAVKDISLSRLGIATTRQSIVDAFNGGAYLLSYIGHGGIHLWADENLFNTSQVDSLSVQAHQPLVLTMDCLNGYFHFPYFDSLAERLVKAEEKGAVAAFSPSGMSANSAAHLYHKALLAELLHGGHERLGDAVMAAQLAYGESGDLAGLLRIYHLFGDPAMRLR